MEIIVLMAKVYIAIGALIVFLAYAVAITNTNNKNISDGDRQLFETVLSPKIAPFVMLYIVSSWPSIIFGFLNREK